MKLVSFGPDCKVHLHPESKPVLQLVQEVADQLNSQGKEEAFFLVDLGDVVKRLELWRQCLPRGKEEAFFLVDLGDVVKRLELWKQCLPRVKPFYAVKCNQDPPLLRLLAHLGAGFDCASKAEIRQILEYGVDPARIVYAHPCKHSSYVQYASKVNVDLMTFDNREELHKIKALFPSARLLLRILPPANFKVLYELGSKFGCHPLDASSLLQSARDLGLNVVGVSFHVGCGVEEGEVYSEAVQTAATVFQEAQAMGFHLHILDVGGGFPSSSRAFRQISAVLRKSLDEHFPEESGVRIFAEPGRFMAETAYTLTARIIAKRQASKHIPRTENGVKEKVLPGDQAFEYYVNDGVYCSFNCILTDLAHPQVEARLVKTKKSPERYVSTVWGPTCDSLDRILNDVMLPELFVGDVINFADMGAYSICLSTPFNGMPAPLMFYHCSETVWKTIFPTSSHKKEAAIEPAPAPASHLPVCHAEHVQYEDSLPLTELR